MRVFLAEQAPRYCGYLLHSHSRLGLNSFFVNSPFTSDQGLGKHLHNPGMLGMSKLRWDLTEFKRNFRCTKICGIRILSAHFL